MKSKNVLISVLSFFSILFFVLFIFSFINKVDVQYKAVASLDKIHILYLNFDNPVTVVVPGIPKEKVIVKSNEVPVKSLGDSKYSIPVVDQALANKNVHLMVYILNSAGKEQIIESIEYTVLNAPDPVSYFANLSEGTISIDEVKNSDSIYIQIPNFYYKDFRYKVVKFNMVYTNKGGFLVSYQQENGSLLTLDQKIALEKIQIGDKINFVDILATYTDPISKKTNNIVRIQKNIEFTVR